MELRLQCEWTAVVNGTPDMNMARAFSPYQCKHMITGELFDRTKHTGFEMQPGIPQESVEDLLKHGWSIWTNPQTNLAWIPTDLHASTAKHAFPGVDETHPDWKHYRGLGKRTNFAVNYGAAPAKIAEALSVSLQIATALVNGYKQSFAGVVDFGKWLQRRVYITDNVPNLLLRRYYSRNKHQLLNWTVQGSGADILLEKLFEVQVYIENKPHWQLMISVHDEVGLTCAAIPYAQLEQEVQEIKQIMKYSLSEVDIISDVECTTTNWAAKQDWLGAVQTAPIPAV